MSHAVVRRDALVARLLVVLASFAFRLPELVHAGEVNSDSAIVGLQAMHVMKGETSAFLWGSGYQSAADAYWAAPFFAFFGKTPFSLVFSALTLHVLATLAMLSMGERHARLARLSRPSYAGALVSLPLVLTTAAIHTYALYPPRQLSITAALVALWLVDRASTSRFRLGHLFGGAALSGLACAADPYALVFVPLVGLSVALSSLESPMGRAHVRLLASSRDRRDVAVRLGAALFGAATGAVPVWLMWRSQGARLGVTNLDASRVAHNTKLLLETCGPWAFGMTSYYARVSMDYAPWDMHPAYALFAKAGGCLFLAFFPAALLLAVTKRRLRFASRRAGVVGALALPLTLYGFLTSVMVMDHFSMRYLASIPLLAPFALVPLLVSLGPKRLAWLLVAPLAAAGISGWVSFGPDVRGPLVAPRPDGPTDEARLHEALSREGVTYAMADYWTAYRVTFVTQEGLVVVPTHEKQDRYRSYRDAFERASRVAYLVDPKRSSEAPEAVGEALAKGELCGKGRVRRADVGRFVVFVVDRAL